MTFRSVTGRSTQQFSATIPGLFRERFGRRTRVPCSYKGFQRLLANDLIRCRMRANTTHFFLGVDFVFLNSSESFCSSRGWLFRFGRGKIYRQLIFNSWPSGKNYGEEIIFFAIINRVKLVEYFEIINKISVDFFKISLTKMSNFDTDRYWTKHVPDYNKFIKNIK